MPLEIRPIKVKGTHYLLVPKVIVDMLNVNSSSRFVLTARKDGEDVFLHYEGIRERRDHQERDGGQV